MALNTAATAAENLEGRVPIDENIPDLPAGTKVWAVYNENGGEDQQVRLLRNGDQYQTELLLAPGANFEYVIRIQEPGKRPTLYPSDENPVSRSGIATSEEKGAQEPQGPTQFESSTEGEEVEVGGSALDAAQINTRTSIAHLIRSGAGVEGPKGARSLYESLMNHTEVLASHARSRDSDVRIYVKKDLQSEVTSQQNEYIEGRDDLDEPEKSILKTPNGRLQFRLNAFSLLCAKGQLGLKPKDNLLPPVTEKKFTEHAQKKLKKMYAVFDRICSGYDAGNIARTLSGIAEEVSSETYAGTEEVTELALRRQKLMDKVSKRVKGGVDGAQGVEESKNHMSKFLSASGDLALKTAAFALFASNPGLVAALVAGGIWTARGVTEAAGYDFGKTVGSAIKLPFSLGKRGAKALVRVLPDRLKDKMPDRINDWAETVSAPSFRKNQRVSLPAATRAKLFLRSLVPAPALLEKIPKVKKIVAGKDVDLAGAPTEKTLENSQKVSEACTTALATLVKRNAAKTAAASQSNKATAQRGTAK